MNRYVTFLFFALFSMFVISKAQAEVVTIEGMIKSIDESGRKITVERKGKETDFDLSKNIDTSSFKTGQRVNLKFHFDLEIVIKIDPISSPSTVESAKPLQLEVLNLDELNSIENDSSLSISSDGLEIFWVHGNVENKMHIWSARRKNAESLFTDKKLLFSGHSPTLSADGLEMLFRNADSETISLTTRKSQMEDFGRPRPVSSLTFPGLDAAPRWLSEDGLTLYLDMKIKNGPHHTWEVNRSSVSANWKKPNLVQVKFDKMPEKFRFTQVTATADNLNLYCTAGFPPKGARVGILSRKDPIGPFTKWTEIPLENAQGEYPFCLRPLYVPATNELFLVSKQFFADPALAKTRGSDLWVIKNFKPPMER
tara:strand:- start:39343 stop:40446 length:1104 start_codon:yes stop_codon:yes gene_type:complete